MGRVSDDLWVLELILAKFGTAFVYSKDDVPGDLRTTSFHLL